MFADSQQRLIASGGGKNRKDVADVEELSELADELRLVSRSETELEDAFDELDDAVDAEESDSDPDGAEEFVVECGPTDAGFFSTESMMGLKL